MNTDDFLFDLPEELIASRPAEKRDESRLLVARRDSGYPFEHRRFRDIREYLRPGDLLVMNDSRVLPARLFARRATGGQVEILLLSPEESSRPEPRWRALVRPGKKVRDGETLVIEPGVLEARPIARHNGGERTIEFLCSEDFRLLLERFGHMPLPPYIMKRRAAEGRGRGADLYIEEDRERYQTVYAREEGSVAAPTAGLHFTEELLSELRAGGLETAWVTLHVGAGTFQVMDEGGRVEDHAMHYEEYEISEETSEAIARARAEKRRIVAVGTTSVRTLEAAFDAERGTVAAGRNQTNLMIAPGYTFRVVDAILTNFHLPRSTLILLVSAYLGRERLLQAYEEAIKVRYRFFSYGDAMLLLP